MSNWWIADSGVNMLKGVEGDSSNPIKLEDEQILRFLGKIPKARFDFETIYPSLLPEEQERLSNLLANYPYIKTKIVTDEQTRSDRLQNRNVEDIPETAIGPRGGHGGKY